jgi:hypothetical protein
MAFEAGRLTKRLRSVGWGCILRLRPGFPALVATILIAQVNKREEGGRSAEHALKVEARGRGLIGASTPILVLKLKDISRAVQMQAVLSYVGQLRLLYS